MALASSFCPSSLSASQTYLPRAAAAAIFGAIPGASLASSTTRTLYGTSYPVDLYQYPCDTAVTPSFVFTGGKRQLVKFAEQYLDEGYPAHKSWGGLCQAGIVGVDLDGGKKAILGSTLSFPSFPSCFHLILCSAALSDTLS